MTSFAKVCIYLLVFATLHLLAGWKFLESLDEVVEEGKQLFSEGKYAEAAKSFEIAADEEPLKNDATVAPRLRYNEGTSQYKMAENETDPELKKALLEEAAKNFLKGAGSQEKSLRAKSHYNLGNTQASQGKLKEAADSYRKALRAEPKSAGAELARKNLDAVLKRLAVQPPENQQNQDNNEEPPKDSDEQGESSDSKGKQSQKQSQNEEQSSNDKKDEESNKQDSDSKQERGEGGESESEKPDDSLSEEKNSEKNGDDEEDGEKKENEAGKEGAETESEDEKLAEEGQKDSDSGEGEEKLEAHAGSKMDALERRSRNLRKNRLRKETRSQRSRSGKDY